MSRKYYYLAAVYVAVLLFVGNRWWSVGDDFEHHEPARKSVDHESKLNRVEVTEDDREALKGKSQDEWNEEERRLLEDLPFLKRTPEVEATLERLNEPHRAKHAQAYPEGRLKPGTKHRDKVHLFFTTDCTQHSLWQSLTLEHSWMKVRSNGALSRLVSGCINADGSVIGNQALLERSNIQHERFFIFFGPRINANAVPGPRGSSEAYPPINRPATVHYWFSHVHPPETFLCLLDPDMVFLKPLVYPDVHLGKPVGQFYDYLITEDWDATYPEICVGCPPLTGKRDFCPGPPHMMHRTDWGNLNQWWLRYTVEARKQWGKWVSEMAGMSIALARLGLRSRLEPNGMWDRPNQATDSMKKAGLFDLATVRPLAPNASNPLHPFPLHLLPATLHYCFTPELGRRTYPEVFWKTGKPQQEWESKYKKPLLHYIHWSKYRVPGDWPGGKLVSPSGTLLDCKQDLLFEYPPLTYMLKHYAKDLEDKGWLLFFSGVPTAVNEAVMVYRRMYCPADTPAPRKCVRSAHPGFWKSRYEISYKTTNPRGFTFVDVTTGDEIPDGWEEASKEEVKAIRSFPGRNE